MKLAITDSLQGWLIILNILNKILITLCRSQSPWWRLPRRPPATGAQTTYILPSLPDHPRWHSGARVSRGGPVGWALPWLGWLDTSSHHRGRCCCKSSWCWFKSLSLNDPKSVKKSRPKSWTLGCTMVNSDHNVIWPHLANVVMVQNCTLKMRCQKRST